MASQAKAQADRSLPIVDLSGLRAGDDDARAATVTAIRNACFDKGFFYCVGHGVDPALAAEVFSEAARFFARSIDDKLLTDKRHSHANRGYEPLCGQTLEPGMPPDLKEGYYIGVDAPARDERAQRLINVGPNVWPIDQAAFRAVMTRYFDAMAELAAVILKGIALSLDLPGDYFSAFCIDPLATLRLLHYPPQPTTTRPGQKGCGAHTDFGGITILMQDDVGGLQVWDHDEAVWLDARPLEGAFIVNLGDLMERWTNRRYRSTLHRVINRSGEERYSVPFFFSGNHDYEIDCIESCLAEGEKPLFGPVTVDAYTRQRYTETYCASQAAETSSGVSRSLEQFGS